MKISFYFPAFLLSIGILCCTNYVAIGQKTKGDWKLYPPDTNASEVFSDSLMSDSLVIATPDSSYQSELLEDARLEYLMDKYLTLNEDKITGFRIQIFAVSGPNSSLEARKVNAEFKQSGIDLPSYIEFDNPNFLVRVGDFRTRLEAEKFRLMVQDKFPSAYIVVDDINLPPLPKNKG